MTLKPGICLGPYEVQGLLGTGGMGEVYAARDPRLRRTVAIKVLPVGTAGPMAVARLHREAHAVAALSHPHICPIFDIGEHDGSPFLVMEKLEGETLAARLRTGPLEPTAVTEIGAALADALDAAHKTGVIHRDIKPANIFLTDRGAPKVLDFGLAKATVSSEATTTLGAPQTGPGAPAGTVMYMAPEQLRGEELDGRGDIFSLGLVLYEMACGQRAFSGATTATVATAILTTEPPPIRALRPEVPAELERIVLKALDKEREFRYQSAADLCADLRRLARERKPQSTSALPMVPSAQADQGGPRESVASASNSSDTVIVQGFLRRHLVAVSAGLLILVGSIWGLVAWLPRQSASTPIDSASGTLEMVPLSFSGDIESAAISQDGRFISFVRNNTLWVRQVSATPGDRDIQLVATVAGRTYLSPTFTPTGEHVDFIMSEGDARELWRVPMLGGPPQLIVHNVWSGIGWSPDGRTMAFLRTQPDGQWSAVVTANADGSEERIIARRELPLAFKTVSVSRPSWSPDGREILVVGTAFSREGDVPESELVFLDSIRGGTLRIQRTMDVRQATWMSSSRLMLESFSGGGLFTTLGTTNLRGDEWSPLTRQFVTLADFTPTGDRQSAIAIRWERRTGIWIGNADGENLRSLAPEDASGFASPFQDNAGNLFYSAFLNDGGAGIYRLAANAAQPTLITSKLLGADHWSVSPDGRFIVFTGREGRRPLFRVNSDGSGLVTLVERNTGPSEITPDGQSVLFAAIGPGLLSVPLAGGLVRKISDINVNSIPAVSPDGRQIAFASEQPGVVTVCQLPNCDHPSQLKLNAPAYWSPFRWTPNGTGIAFVKADDPNVWEQPLNRGEARPLTRLAERLIAEFRWSSDGTRLLLSRGNHPISDVVLLKGLR